MDRSLAGLPCISIASRFVSTGVLAALVGLCVGCAPADDDSPADDFPSLKIWFLDDGPPTAHWDGFAPENPGHESKKREIGGPNGGKFEILADHHLSGANLSLKGEWKWLSETEAVFELNAVCTERFKVDLIGVSDASCTIDGRQIANMIVDSGEHDLRITCTVVRRYRRDDPPVPS